MFKKKSNENDIKEHQGTGGNAVCLGLEPTAGCKLDKSIALHLLTSIIRFLLP